MLRSFQSYKLQREVMFYTDDIDWNESLRTMTAPGIIDGTGEEVDVILDEGGKVIRDVRRHNTSDSI